MTSKVPRNFTWVEPGLLCAMEFPNLQEHIQYLEENNVSLLVNLTESREPPAQGFTDLRMIRISIPDFTAPTLDQIKEFLDLISQAKRDKKVAGVIYTDTSSWITFCACYYINMCDMSKEHAISEVINQWTSSSFSQEMMHTIDNFEVSKPQRPRDFFWLEDKLCALAFPSNKKQLSFLVNNNVTYLVCLTEEGEPEVDDHEGLKKFIIKMSHVPHKINLDQIGEFLAFIDLAHADGKVLAVTCSDGDGRLGVVLACYLVQMKCMSASEAVEKIDDLRRGSLETKEHEEVVLRYEMYRKKVPRRFSWLVKNKLCAMAFPEEWEHLQYLVDHGVKYLVCLTEERDPDVQMVPELSKVDIKMRDYSCPTLNQVHDFLTLMDRAAQEDKAVGIHCHGGRGRTGTMIACYFVQKNGMTAAQALEKTRHFRPGSVETSSQEKFIRDFEKTIRQLPDNFSWVVDGLLCTLAFPEFQKNLQYLVDNNVRYLVSLTAEREPPVDQCPELEMISLKSQDFTPPTVIQVEMFLSILENAEKKKQAVALHCSQGQGRTGVMIACYLVKVQGLNARDAIEKIRFMRPGSVETKLQEKLVHEYEAYLKMKESGNRNIWWKKKEEKKNLQKNDEKR